MGNIELYIITPEAIDDIESEGVVITDKEGVHVEVRDSISKEELKFWVEDESYSLIYVEEHIEKRHGVKTLIGSFFKKVVLLDSDIVVEHLKSQFYIGEGERILQK